MSDNMKINVAKIFGENVFDDATMQERLPKKVYTKLHQIIAEGGELDIETADVIAHEMKEWAIEKGATHFTHWFQPLTGVTAEKHDSFITAPMDNGKVLMSFSGKELIKGEADASSFPSGGLRATFEARGYTAWDCTSPAFVKDGSLYIPTLFCSYTGEALDNKTPLLKSCDALNKEALRLLPSLGMKDVTSVTSYVGSEQEYFLVAEEYYKKRLDLRLTGRTLYGALPPKGQELDDHYFGSINKKVSDFMKDLDNELWKYGIPAKTKHNESAPAQHEIACIYRQVNITTDNNHLVMQTMKDLAKKHGLRCLLHEKPFAGVNGSGKHNNWSVVTNTNVNLFRPGSDPINNLPFLATLACVVKGVDEYADLLRLSIASAGNDHRLGGNEAPPATISMFLGDDINNIIDSVIENKELKGKEKDRFQTGVSVIPDFAKDRADRNRTSPFAFTGNKFEFRGVGSSQSIANPNTMLNSILAIEMKEMADLIESGKDATSVIRDFFNNHKRVIFEGDGYSYEWEKEVLKRGLSNIKNTVDAICRLKDVKLVDMLITLGVYSKAEIESRYEVLLESYCKTIQVEALTASKMARNEIFPACIAYLKTVSKTLESLRENKINNEYLYREVNDLSNLLAKMKTCMDKLDENIKKARASKNSIYQAAVAWRDDVLLAMNELRMIVDTLETKVDENYWPMPNYIDLLYGI